MRDGKMFQCDKCKRPISTKGLKIQSVINGDYQTAFFACPHCGEKYHVNTTDGAQRDLLSEQQAWMEKIKLGRRKKFRQKTLNSYQRHLEENAGKVKERAEKLAKIGEKLLRGENYGSEDCEENPESL